MKKLILAVAAHCVLGLTLPAQTVPEPAKELDNYLANLVAENKLSGVVLVAKDGVTVASKVAGIANKATNAPIDLNTKFNLGSINKTFTALAIAQLIQQGRVSLDDALARRRRTGGPTAHRSPSIVSSRRALVWTKRVRR